MRGGWIRSFNPLALASEALCLTAKAFAMRKLGLFMRAFLEYFAISVRLCVVFSVITSLLFEILAITHLYSGLTLRLSHAVVENKRMLVLHLELGELLTNQSLYLLEDLHIVLGDESDGLSGLASSGGAAHSVHVVFRVGRNVKIDDNVHRRDVETA